VDKNNLFVDPVKNLEELKLEKLKLLDEMEKKEQEELNKKPAKSFMSKFEDTTEDVKITFVNEN
jgi:uncharacterized protein YnzC (UPF0291/DUF896 family)